MPLSTSMLVLKEVSVNDNPAQYAQYQLYKMYNAAPNTRGCTLKSMGDYVAAFVGLTCCCPCTLGWLTHFLCNKISDSETQAIDALEATLENMKYRNDPAAVVTAINLQLQTGSFVKLGSKIAVVRNAIISHHNLSTDLANTANQTRSQPVRQTMSDDNGQYQRMPQV